MSVSRIADAIVSESGNPCENLNWIHTSCERSVFVRTKPLSEQFCSDHSDSTMWRGIKRVKELWHFMRNHTHRKHRHFHLCTHLLLFVLGCCVNVPELYSEPKRDALIFIFTFESDSEAVEWHSRHCTLFQTHTASVWVEYENAIPPNNGLQRSKKRSYRCSVHKMIEPAA